MRRLAAATLALLAAGAAAEPPAAGLVAAIDACLARVRADAGATAIGPYCPDTALDLETGPWALGLPVADAAELTPLDLEDLRTLTAPYAAGRDDAAVPRGEALDAVLAGLGTEHEARRLTAWQRFGRWLREQLGDRIEMPDFVERLREQLAGWLAPLGPAAGRTVGWVLLGGLGVLLVGAVVLTARAMASRHRERAPGDDGVADATTPLAAAPGTAGLDELRALPPGAAVRRLLELLLAALHGRGLLPSPRVLTAREAAALAGPLDADAHARLGRIARAAERAAFGGVEPAAAEVAALVDDARTLVTPARAAAGTP